MLISILLYQIMNISAKISRRPQTNESSFFTKGPEEATSPFTSMWAYGKNDTMLIWNTIKESILAITSSPSKNDSSPSKKDNNIDTTYLDERSQNKQREESFEKELENYIKNDALKEVVIKLDKYLKNKAAISPNKLE